MPPDSIDTKLGSSNQEASPSASKNTWGSFSVMFTYGSALPTAISGGVDISEVPAG